MWNPFKPKPKKIIVPTLEEMNDLILTCPPQQLVTRKCVCMRCEKRGVCYTERLIASENNCGNTWVSACSLSTSNTEHSMFNSIFGEYYESLKGRFK